VLILVDRGGGSFATATTGIFFNVRSAVEDVIATVDAQYRFGLGVYTGQHPGGSLSTCSMVYDSVPFALGNADAIKAKYDTLGPLLPYGTKAETPATEALTMASAALTTDVGVGGRYLLFITTGASDFCDDETVSCPADGAIFEIQQLWAHAPSVETLVVGVPSTLTPAGVLQDFANAGTGQSVALFSSSGGTQPSDIYYQCTGLGGGDSVNWHNIFVSTGKAAPNAIATYSTPGGTAPLYMAATSAVADVQTQVAAALTAAKSCAWDLASFSIDPSKLGEATVTLNGAPLAEDAGIGWSMPTTNELTLNGPACAAWRTAGATITFNFPCDTVLP
jgi:hypothetical protein